MQDMLELGKEVLASQPFSIPLRAQLMQQHGFAHGGVISYAADNALTYAGASALGAGVVTSEFNIARLGNG